MKKFNPLEEKTLRRGRSGRSSARQLAFVLCALVSGANPAYAVAQEAPAKGPIEFASWLAGCWRSTDDGRVSEEQWMAPTGGSMLGMSRSVGDGEMRGFELLVLRTGTEGLVYHAFPSGQNPTAFPATHVSQRRLVFEKPDHDFPRKIAYEQTTPDSAVARVFADGADERPAFALAFARVPCGGSSGLSR